MSKEINIFEELTPNPASIKFIVNKLLYNGNLDFPNPQSTNKSPIAQELFAFNFVKNVFIASNFITITKHQDFNWEDIKPILREFIKSALQNDVAISIDDNNNTSPKQDFQGSETEIKIQEILNEYVQPAIEQDGGAIAFKSFDKGTVTVQLRGACSGCPSSTLTLKSGIESLLRRMVPEVEEVVSEAL